MNTALPARARVVVVGGGAVGTSTAYHLAHLGWTDVLLLEQGTLSCGTTWHAAGLVGLLRASESGTRLVQYSADLYARLEAETGLGTGYRQCGGLIVARTESPADMSPPNNTSRAPVAFPNALADSTSARPRQRWTTADAGTERNAPAPSRLRDITSTMPSFHNRSDGDAISNGATATRSVSSAGAARDSQNASDAAAITPDATVIPTRFQLRP